MFDVSQNLYTTNNHFHRDFQGIWELLLSTQKFYLKKYNCMKKRIKRILGYFFKNFITKNWNR